MTTKLILKKISKWLGIIVAGIIILVLCALFCFRIAAFFRESHDRQTVAPSGGHFVQAGDVKLFIQEMGSSTNPAVIFIHGTGAWSETWKQTMRVVTAQGFHAIAVDMPPFGYSTLPSSAKYSREDQAKRIIALLDTLHIQKATIVGHSYGGGATVEVAMLAPDRVSSLVLVDPALGLDSGDEQPLLLIKSILAWRPIRNIFVASTISNPIFSRKLLTLFINDPRNATDAWVNLYQQPMNVKGVTNAVGDWLPTLIYPDSVSKSSDKAMYAKLGMPVHIIWGEKDSITPLVQGKHLHDLIPHSELTVLPNVGHIPQIEDPRQFEKALLQFLQQS